MASTLAPRQTFRETVALVAARAKAKLPECNGRVESAVKLVLAGDVFVRDDGGAEVGSGTDPLSTHRVRGTNCSCDDSQYGRAPQGFCKHVLAVMIATRVHQEMAPRSTPVESEPEIELPTDFETWGDNDIEEPLPEAVEAPSQPPAPVPLPEAPASVNVRVTISGREVQWTLRDTDEARLAARLDALLARYPLPQAPAPAPPLSPQQHNAMAMPRPTVGFCAVHNVAMVENQKNGQRWFSHRLPEGGFCKGR